MPKKTPKIQFLCGVTYFGQDGHAKFYRGTGVKKKGQGGIVRRRWQNWFRARVTETFPFQRAQNAKKQACTKQVFGHVQKNFSPACANTACPKYPMRAQNPKVQRKVQLPLPFRFLRQILSARSKHGDCRHFGRPAQSRKSCRNSFRREIQRTSMFFYRN